MLSHLETLRGVALGRNLDSLPNGPPNFHEFSEQLTRLSKDSAPGPDELLGKSWVYAPFWLKVRIFELFTMRFEDINWDSEDVATWKLFLLMGIPKCRSPASFKDFRWIGIMEK